MERACVQKTKRLIGTIFVFVLLSVCFSFESQAAMSFDEMEQRLSAYSDSFAKTEGDTFYMEYEEWDISEESFYYVISDIAESLMGEPVEDYCKVHIKFYYTDKLYGKDFQTFGDNLFRVKKMLGNFWTEWSRYNKMEITVTSYNRVCDKYSANVTLQFNGSEDGTWGEAYDEKLLSLVSEAQRSCDSDMEMVQYFLKWLSENASYSYFTGYTNDPYYAMIVGKTVCGGYANAFKDLCNAAGIPAIVPVNQELNHAWSQVYVNGKWYTADLCNVVKSKSETYNGYLFTDPNVELDCKDFVEKHKAEYINSFKYSDAVNIGVCTVTYDNSHNYTGSYIKPAVTVKFGDKILKEGTHYNVTYSSNKLPGTASITIEGIKKNGYKGERTYSFKIAIPKPKLSANAGKASVELKWNAVSGATGYIIRMYNSQSGKFEDLAKVKGTSCTVKELSAGKKYVFAVRSYVSADSSEYKSAQTKLTVYTLPGKVKNLKITAVKADSLKLKWSKTDTAKKYEIYISTDGKSWDKAATTAKTSYKVKDLKANKKYYFKVRAVNSSGKGSFSSKKSKTTLLAAPEVELASGAGEITVKWNKISKSNGYVVAYSSNKDMINSSKITVKKRKNTASVISSLKTNKNYYVRVRAYKTVNGKKVYGQYSSIVKIKTK